MWKMGSVNGMNISSTTHEMERAVSENIASILVPDNSEETKTRDP